MLMFAVGFVAAIVVNFGIGWLVLVAQGTSAVPVNGR